MATATVGGAFLSAFLDVIFQRLASPEVANLIQGKKLDHKLLQRLETILKVVRAVLNDAENKQITNSDVNNWLNDLKDAVYVADDLLDEVSTKAATQKEVSNLFSRLFNVQDREMASKLEVVVDRLESLLRLKESLDLKEIAMHSNLSCRIPSTSLEDGSHVYGRDKDKEAVINLLLEDNSHAEVISVMPIVGMGGVGKTTLAQLVYNDDNLKHIFDLRVWVCVSEEFDITKITKNIVEAFTRKRSEVNDLNLLQLDLQDKLKGKKFLIVLDDVWIEDYVNWNFLKRPFQQGIRGSKVLVTTRNEKVASVVQTVQTFHLGQLSDEDCWLVFANHACLSSQCRQNVTTLERIGREIVKKCKGLPLAAQSLGGMLRRKHDIRDWNNILNSDIWELSERESKIIPALRISYHYLAPHLKRCFVYCSLYPKDYEFNKDELILLWMAEDLLLSPKKGKTLEEVGYQYFDELASQSFFQHSSNSIRKNSFVMHDLMHDLAMSLGGEFYFRSEEVGKDTKISIKTRHLSFAKFRDPILENIEVFGRVKFLRTFLPMNFKVSQFNNEKVPCIILSKLKYLRVLSFCGFPNLGTLPNSIGKLIHLRYLDLSETSIMKLPESLWNLYNLQTLKLFGCFKLTMLPSGMQNLVNLRHLDIGLTHLKEMPRGMGKLVHLQHLDYFIVGKHEENGIKELGELSNLHGLLCIMKLENVTNDNEALEARIKNKKHIDSLSLQWSLGDNCIDSQIERDILSKLQPHQDLKLLSISGFRGTRFPDWVGNFSYHNITDISLSFCNNCCMLPSLGQLPSLKYLVISHMNSLEIIDANFYSNDYSSLVTPFPSLESLEFYDMPSWEVWSSFELYAFPLLEHLKISCCPKLRGNLPNHLPTLQELRIRKCEQLTTSLPSAPAIQKLEILKSNKVKFTLQDKHESLDLLSIDSSCDSLISLPLETFPNLNHLCIKNCENLESLSFSVSQPLKNLNSFEIFECPNFVLFPRQGLPAPSLTRFIVSNCDKLQSLPHQMSTFFPKLEYTEIQNCSEIESFPEGGMPPYLRSIVISNCEKLLSGVVWPSMDMLTNVRINGPCDGIKSFPKEYLLPPSLMCLELIKFSCLETLNCKGLFHLPSLQRLTIKGCPNLKTLANGMLPTSLMKLYIFGCPLLEQQCQMKHPHIWPKISHIHDININHRWIS